jgi:hypothetical protein
MGYDYLPIELGRYMDYHVDSIVFDPFTQRTDTVSYLLREMIADTFYTEGDQLVYRVERQRLNSDFSIHSLLGSYGLLPDSLRMEKIDNNVKSTLLIFPPVAGDVWNGFAEPDGQWQEYTYEYIDQFEKHEILGDLKTLLVVQISDTLNVIEQNLARETYAREVGLLRREQLSKVVLLSGDSGFHVIQNLIGVGIE